MLTPTQKGSITEAVITAEAVKAGVVVLHPFNEGVRYDLAFDFGGGRIGRVQCKTGNRRGDVIAVPARTCRHTPHGYIRTSYDETEVDALAVYCHETDRCYLLPIQDVAGRGNVYL